MFYILWEYAIKRGRRREFERHYRSNGTWAQFFRKDRNFIETILLRDCQSGERYLTIDVWKNSQAYRAFKRRFKADYERIDRECAALTSQERCLGVFESSTRLSSIGFYSRGNPKRTMKAERSAVRSRRSGEVPA